MVIFSLVIFALYQISIRSPLFGDFIVVLNPLYHLLLLFWKTWTQSIKFSFSHSVGSTWITRNRECITVCAVTPHSSGESKDQEILKENTPPNSFSSVSCEALDKNIPMLFYLSFLFGMATMRAVYIGYLLVLLFLAFRAVNMTY